jgi:hypothetical protein
MLVKHKKKQKNKKQKKCDIEKDALCAGWRRSIESKLSDLIGWGEIKCSWSKFRVSGCKQC